MEPYQPFDPNRSQQNYPPSGQNPTVPPPPPGEVNVRTMQSDVKSMQEQGGAAPVPEPVSPIYTAGPSETPPTEPTNSKRWLWLLLLLIVLAVAAGGYYYVYVTPAAVEEESIVEEPGPGPVPPKPESSGVDLSALNDALRSEASQILPPGNLKEISLVNEQGTGLLFSDIISVILPSLAGGELVNVIEDNFSEDFRVYLYYDERGVWPIYRVPISSDATTDIITLRAQLASMENADLGNFYIDPPGTAGSFRDGQVGGIPTRYSTFSQPGASFNYGIFNNELVISASYDGLKKVLE